MEDKYNLDGLIIGQLDRSTPDSQLFMTLRDRTDSLFTAVDRQRHVMQKHTGGQYGVILFILLGIACFFVALILQVVNSQPAKFWVPLVLLVATMASILARNEGRNSPGLWPRLKGWISPQKPEGDPEQGDSEQKSSRTGKPTEGDLEWAKVGRWAGINALLKLSEKALLMRSAAKFRESIGAAIPQIITLLSDRDSDVCKASADALVKLSEQAEFRESIGAAIPQVITLLSDRDSDVRRASADALVKLSEQAFVMRAVAEFRESLGATIPQIITLLSDRDSDVCKVSADALAKLSEQAEFRESIGAAIPQIITLLSDRDSDVCTPNTPSVKQDSSPGSGNGPTVSLSHSRRTIIVKGGGGGRSTGRAWIFPSGG
ncbi:armadillo-type protein [Mycena sp. CBHHK59/15]|nr:armadillo-type protein [Mycena sp. CBHHK59/15]